VIDSCKYISKLPCVLPRTFLLPPYVLTCLARAPAAVASFAAVLMVLCVFWGPRPNCSVHDEAQVSIGCCCIEPGHSRQVRRESLGAIILRGGARTAGSSYSERINDDFRDSLIRGFAYSINVFRGPVHAPIMQSLAVQDVSDSGQGQSADT